MKAPKNQRPKAEPAKFITVMVVEAGKGKRRFIKETIR